jgi:hypothetical protein
MMFRKNSLLPLLLTAVTLSGSSCNSRSYEGKIIVSETGSEVRNTVSDDGGSWRCLPNSRIIAIDPDKPSTAPEILTGEFFSAVSPEVSFDAKHMLFAGQRKEGDTWQIWEMDLSDLKSKNITPAGENCSDPAYLPGDRIVFSKSIAGDSLKSGYSLYTCNTDGSDIKRITFSPDNYNSPAVLGDGRILAVSRQAFPEPGKQMFTVLRPNGTKADLFYKDPDSALLTGPARETADGRLVFVLTKVNGNDRPGIYSIAYNRPLHSRISMTASIDGEFLSCVPLKSGKMLVSYRKSGSEKYSLREFDPETGSVTNCLHADPGFNVLEAAVVEERERQKKLPSEVDMHVKTGLILCQDVNCFDPAAKNNGIQPGKAVSIEVMGVNGSLGKVDVEEDGSFQLKPLADMPFRIVTIDEKGRVISGPCNWIWLRPNERRGCIGCHEDPEQVPRNVISLAVKKKPVIIPVHVEKIKEKSVDLE